MEILLSEEKIQKLRNEGGILNENIYGIKKKDQETEDWKSYKEFFFERKEVNSLEIVEKSNNDTQKDMRKFKNEEDFEKNSIIQQNYHPIFFKNPNEISKNELSLQNNDKKEENFIDANKEIDQIFEIEKMFRFYLSEKPQENNFNIANLQRKTEEIIEKEFLKQNNHKIDENYIENYKENEDNFTIKQKNWNLLDSIRNNGIPVKKKEISPEKTYLTTNLLEINFDKTISQEVSIENPIKNFIKNEEENEEEIIEKPKENKEESQKEVFSTLIFEFLLIFL